MTFQPSCGAKRGLPLRRCAAFNSPLFPMSFEIASVCGIVGAALLHLGCYSDRTTSSVCVCVYLVAVEASYPNVKIYPVFPIS